MYNQIKEHGTGILLMLHTTMQKQMDSLINNTLLFGVFKIQAGSMDFPQLKEFKPFKTGFKHSVKDTQMLILLMY